MKKVIKYSTFTIVFTLLYMPIIINILNSVNISSNTFSFEGFTLKWFFEIFTNESLAKSIINTWIVAIFATLLSLIVGLVISLGIYSSTKKQKKLLLYLNNIPVINADIVSAISLMTMFIIFRFTFGFPTMLLAHVFFCVPFVVLTVLPRLRTVSNDYFEAALDLGLSKTQAFIKVVLPNLKGSLLVAGLIAFTMSIDDFVISYFTTGNGFDNFSIWLYTRLGRKTFSPSAFAYNTLITLVGIFIALKVNKKRYKE